MGNLNLNNEQKKASQALLESIQSGSNKDANQFVSDFPLSEASWLRFTKAAYNHPISWWIGIMQLQMQMGILGYQKKAMANAMASQLWQTTRPLRDSKTTAPILIPIIKYNIKYRKSDFSGRTAGGVFTNYASKGGAIGRKVMPKGLSLPISASNFIIASYGAAIKGMASGNRNVESIVQSMLTGRSESLHIPKLSQPTAELSKEEQALYDSSQIAINEVINLSQVSPSPSPIKEFCLKPENINLSGICK